MNRVPRTTNTTLRLVRRAALIGAAATLAVCCVFATAIAAERYDGVRRLPPQPSEFRSWADDGDRRRDESDPLPMTSLIPDAQRGRTTGRYVYFQNPHEEEIVPGPGPGAGTPEIIEGPPGRLDEGQTIGEEPEDYNVQFLRSQGVLLSHGDWQLDYGLVYAISENDIPIALVDGGGAVVGATEALLKSRLLTVPLEFRYGLRDDLQLSFNVPVGWSNSEVSFDGFDDFDSEAGIGDMTAAFSYVVCDGARFKPDVVLTMSLTAPTGNADFPLLTSLTPNSVLAEGFWGASAQLLFIHTYDPVVVFYGGGYRHRFEEDFFNPTLPGQQDVNPGEAVFYQLGVGFGVNEWITLSTSFAGQYISELEVDGDRIEGTILEPVRMRFAVTMNTEHKLIEPFAEIGMTDAAVNARFGVVWTHTHRHADYCR